MINGLISLVVLIAEIDQQIAMSCVAALIKYLEVYVKYEIALEKY